MLGVLENDAEDELELEIDPIYERAQRLAAVFSDSPPEELYSSYSSLSCLRENAVEYLTEQVFDLSDLKPMDIVACALDYFNFSHESPLKNDDEHSTLLSVLATFEESVLLESYLETYTKLIDVINKTVGEDVHTPLFAALSNENYTNALILIRYGAEYTGKFNPLNEFKFSNIDATAAGQKLKTLLTTANNNDAKSLHKPKVTRPTVTTILVAAANTSPVHILTGNSTANIIKLVAPKPACPCLIL